MEMCPCGFLISAANDRMYTRGKWNHAAHLRVLNTIVCQQLRSILRNTHIDVYNIKLPHLEKYSLKSKTTVEVHNCHLS